MLRRTDTNNNKPLGSAPQRTAQLKPTTPRLPGPAAAPAARPQANSSSKTKTAEPNHNTHDGVRNVNGTSDPRYAKSKSRTGKSWIATYRQETGSRRSTCARLQCSGPAAVGAHVLRTDGRKNNSWHLVPVCHTCNHHTNTEVMWMDSRTTLMPLSPSRRS